MTPEQIDSLEHRLGIRLPVSYREVMLTYPFASDSSAAQLWLLDDPKRLLDINGVAPRPWPREYFAIGTDGGELTYVLNTDAAPFHVKAFDLETGTLEPYAPTFPAFVALLHEELETIEKDQQTRAAAYRNKKWWQFWIQP